MFPFFKITNDIQIPTYYLALSLITIICLIWVTRRSDNNKLSRDITLDLSLIIMISSFVGARFMHVFFEETEFYRDHPENIFKFWNGGFVYYGGALLSAFCSIYFLKKKCKSLLNNYLDLFTPVLSLAYGLGRLACLLAGCCYGKTCELPWALEGRHPTQAYASLWELGVLVILLKLESISRRPAQNTFLRTKGSLFYLWLILHGIGRLIMENYREDFRGPIWMMSISSWMSLAIILIGLFWFLKLRSKNNSKTISL